MRAAAYATKPATVVLRKNTKTNNLEIVSRQDTDLLEPRSSLQLDFSDNSDFKRLVSSAFMLRALENPCRQRILYLLHQQGDMSVREIYIYLRTDPSTISQHLTVLRKAGFVQSNKEGRNVNYTILQEALSKFFNILAQMSAIEVDENDTDADI